MYAHTVCPFVFTNAQLLSMSGRWCSSSDFTYSVAYIQTSLESTSMHFHTYNYKSQCLCVYVCAWAHILYCTHREYELQAKHCNNVRCSNCSIFSCCSPVIVYFQ